jgi:hypothetical protein
MEWFTFAVAFLLTVGYWRYRPLSGSFGKQQLLTTILFHIIFRSVLCCFVFLDWRKSSARLWKKKIV